MRNDTYNPANAIHRSEKDGWMLVYVGIPWPGPWPKKSGDLFVVDPHGWQAGITWESSGSDIKALADPGDGRWGCVSSSIPFAGDVRERLDSELPPDLAATQKRTGSSPLKRLLKVCYGPNPEIRSVPKRPFSTSGC